MSPGALQYEMDNEVKFRQIDLQNGLFDLYTDVPIQIKKMDEKNKILKQTLGRLRTLEINEVDYQRKLHMEDFSI